MKTASEILTLIQLPEMADPQFEAMRKPRRARIGRVGGKPKRRPGARRQGRCVPENVAVVGRAAASATRYVFLPSRFAA